MSNATNAILHDCNIQNYGAHKYSAYSSYIQKSHLHSIRLIAIAEVSNMNSLTNTGLIEVGNIVVKLRRRLEEGKPGEREREKEREGGGETDRGP